MIIGGNKDKVIENIQKNIKEEQWNKKVEVSDPVLSEEERNRLLKRFYQMRKHKVSFFFQSLLAYGFIDILGFRFNRSVAIEGLENIKDIQDGAIVTSNHFNPLDNMVVRKMIRKRYKKNLYIVSQETNLALPGFLGYLINHLHILPLCKGPNYIIQTFKPELKKILSQKNYVLIYPEEEMWFNYRKPRPCKRGAYQFAAEMHVPVISCFVEIIDTDKPDNEQFNQVKYIIHVLKPIYPDNNKSLKENSKDMALIDYQQKKEAYEKAYHKKLDYTFYYEDIAGWRDSL